jgi:hypothetical protein
VPWPGGSAARGGGGAVRLSLSSFFFGSGGFASIGFTSATGGALLTLETLITNSLFPTFAVGQWGVRQQGVGKSGAAICGNRGGLETVVNAPSRTSLQLKRIPHSSLPREIVMFADVLLRVQRRSSRR